MPDTFNASVVSATGTLAGSYMALGTTDTASRVVVCTGLYTVIGDDLATDYSGAGSSFPAGYSHYADQGIGLIINIPYLASVDSAGDSVYRTTSTVATRHPKNSASFTYFYSFSPAATDSAISHTTLTYPSPTLGIKNVNSQANITVYPNPSNEMLNITGLNTTDQLSLYDMMGRVINQNWAVTHEGTNTFRYSSVPAGAYILIVSDTNGNVKARVPVRKQ